MPVVTSAAQLLREGRRSSGLTQVELAARAGMTQSVVSAYESGHRQPSLPKLLALLRANGYELEGALVAARDPSPMTLSGPLGRRLRQHSALVKAIATSHGVRDVRVFGSVARGTERPDSDIDLLVAVSDGVGLFTLGRLLGELEDLLQARVDLIPEAGLREAVRESIEFDLVAL